MKTNLLKISCSLVLFLFILSCSKNDENAQKETVNLKSSDIIYGIDINLPLNNQNLADLLLNEDDSEDEKINFYLYYLSLSIEDLVKSSNFNREVIRLAKESPIQAANLVTLTKSFPAFKTEINQKLTSKGVTFDEIVAGLTYSKGNIFERYEPCIFVPNISIADPDKQPIFSPNIEVDCSNDEAIEDFIVAWYYMISGEKKEVMMGEEHCKLTTNPIFLLDNGEINPKSNIFEILPPDDENLKSTQTTTSFHSHEYQANHRYETSGGKTEFTVVAYRIDPQGSVHWIYNSSGWKEIAKIHKNDIGKLLYKWTSHCNNYTPYNQNYVYWNTYERDWNRSEKDLGSATANGTTIYLAGRRKYGYEWYSYDPAQLQGKNTDLNYIYWNWAKWHDNDKSKLRIWRVEQ
jgi:hypothetical protein